MSPLRKNAVFNRRAFLKRSGVTAALVALPVACWPIEPAIASPDLQSHSVLLGVARGNVQRVICKIEDGEAKMTTTLIHDHKRYSDEPERLSPKGQRMWDAAMAQLLQIVEFEASEEGWE